MDKAYQSGMSVGLVSNSYVTHASPSPNYANSASRSWYADKSMWVDGAMPENRKACKPQ